MEKEDGLGHDRKSEDFIRIEAGLMRLRRQISD
jgi:hypothetical protein